MDNNFINIFNCLFNKGKLEIREIVPKHKQTGDYKHDINKFWIYNKKNFQNYIPPKDKECFNGVVEGQRNFALGRITDKLKYSNYADRYDLAKKIIIQWNERNKPSYTKHELLKGVAKVG